MATSKSVGRPKGSINRKTKPKSKSAEKREMLEHGLRCSKCGEEHNVLDVGRHFYISFSDLYASNFENRITICKKCVVDIYNSFINKTNDVKMATKLTCQKLDYYWDETLFNACLDLCKNSSDKVIIQYYIWKSNSLRQYKDLTFSDYLLQVPEEDIKNEIVEKQNQVIKESENNPNEKRYDKKWMGKYTQGELDYLNNYFKKLSDDFNVVTQNHIDYAKKIAKASLIMDKEFEKILEGKGSEGSYEKYKRIFDDLSKSAQFAESGRGKSLVGNGLTEMVDLVESGQWVPELENFTKDDIDLLLNQFNNIDKSI